MRQRAKMENNRPRSISVFGYRGSAILQQRDEGIVGVMAFR